MRKEVILCQNHTEYVSILAISGGLDNGASYGYIDEDDTSLAVGFYLDYELRLAGVPNCMTRKKDEYVHHGQRSTMSNIKRPELFVSIHCDAYHKKTASGMTVHVYKYPSMGALRAAGLIDKQLRVHFPQHRHRGIKKSNFHVLRETQAPAVLVECEFLSNPDTRKFLREPENQKYLAQAISRGAIKYLEGIGIR